MRSLDQSRPLYRNDARSPAVCIRRASGFCRLSHTICHYSMRERRCTQLAGERAPCVDTRGCRHRPLSLTPCSSRVCTPTERNMQGSGTSHEALERCETTVRQYIAQGQYTWALRVLIQHYQDAIISYCRCHLLDQELAQEVAQEIFLTAFERMPGFRGHSSMKTWLYGIAWKKCGEVRRTRKRRAMLVRAHQDTIRARVHCDPPSPPEDLVSQEGRRRRVWHALHRLRRLRTGTLSAAVSGGPDV